MCDKTIAVIMTAYNEEEIWIHECMQSILTQTYKDFHLYVLLDNPENESLKTILRDYEKEDTRVSFYVNDQNLGLVKSLNKLLGMVTEEFVARMDADDVMEVARLEKEMQFMEEHALDFVISNCSFLYANGKIGKGATIPTLIGEQFNEAQKYGNVSMHNTWLQKKSVYDALGGYRLVAHCEDYDYVLRAIQAGYKIGRMDEELVKYRLRDTSISAMYAKEQFEKSRLLRYAYSKGKRIDMLSPDKLNEVYSAYSDEEKEKFAKAKQDIDGFCSKLYDGKLARAAVDAAKMLLSNKEARKLFVNSMVNNRKMKAVYNKKEQ